MCQDASQPCVYLADERRELVFKSFRPPGVGSKRQKISSKGLPTRIQPSQQLSSQSTAPAQPNPIPTLPSNQGLSQEPTPTQSTSGLEVPSADLISIQSQQTLSIPFFRWFGPTGIAPGYRRFFVPIKHGTEVQGHSPLATTTLSTGNNMTSPLYLSQTDEGSDPHLFEQDDGLTPLSTILFPLIDTFFEYYSCHFPFLSKDPFIHLVREKKVPAILLNSMCAMAALCSDLPVFQGRPAYLRGEAFCNKAKYLLVPLLNMPSYEVLESILMITWMELATCHDVGLWMYTGMAVRMAEDMGVHKVIYHLW